MDNAEQELRLDIDAFIPTLLTRPMGTALIRVSQFNEWIESTGIECPVEIPDVKYYPVELFLFRLSLNAQTLSSPQRARDLVEANAEMSAQVDCLRKHKALRDLKDHSLYTGAVGAHACRAWSKHIKEAIESGELALFDFISKLPMKISSDELTQLDTTEPKAIGSRERDTLLNIIGVLLELIKSPKPGRSSDAAVIKEMLDNYSEKAGIKERTLQEKFAAAKKSLTSS